MYLIKKILILYKTSIVNFTWMIYCEGLVSKIRSTFRV